MHSRTSSYSDFSQDVTSESGHDDAYDSDCTSIGSSDSAVWRQGEDYNDRHEQLNEELLEAFRNGNARRAEKLLEEIDDSRIYISSSELIEVILQHDDLELFEVAECNEILCPSQNDAQEWLEAVIANKSTNLIHKIVEFFRIDDEQLIDILDEGEPEEVEFILKYVLRKFASNPNFENEIRKCVDLFETGQWSDLRIITAMQYESMRHPFDSFEYKIRHELLSFIDPKLARMRPDKLFDYLRQKEEELHDYFGANLSYNSDDELSDNEIEENKKTELKDLTGKAKLDKVHGYIKALINKEDVAVNADNIAQTFPPYKHSYEATRQSTIDLATLNSGYQAAVSERRVQAFLDSLKTKFVLHFFRGLSYYTTLWNKPARDHHHKLVEVGQPIMAAAAYNGAGISIGTSRNYTHDELKRDVEPHANQLVQLSAKFKAQKDIIYPLWSSSRHFSSVFTLFHEIYTKNYDYFPQFLRAINSGVQGNPVISTGETARHPFNYALGTKIYEGHEAKRQPPRYRQNGLCERPYSGKVLYIRMGLEHLSTTAMASIPQLNYQAEISVNLHIISEREASFWGIIPGNWVIGQAKAKYPSFNGKYKPKYLEKYGLTKEFYDDFALATECFAPHTPENKLCELLLGTYLSAFYEQKAMAYCIDYAQGPQPVFMNIDGSFSFGLERDSPHRNGTPEYVKSKYRTNQNNMAARYKDAKPRKLDFKDKLRDITHGISKLGIN